MLVELLTNFRGEATLQHRTNALEPSPMIAPAQNPELSTAQQQIRKLLERAIDGLPDSLRTVFVMRDVD